MGDAIKISVHQRADGLPGFIVKIIQGDRLVRFPTDSLREATLLAESIRDGLNAGVPVEALLAGAESGA